MSGPVEDAEDYMAERLESDEQEAERERREAIDDASLVDGGHVERPPATGPGAPCEWCREPIPAGSRRDAKTCSKACRQSHWRFVRQRGPVAPRGETPARLAYADPPYPGKAHLYRDHPDYAGEVDHFALLQRLSAYDGWALSTASDSLELVLGHVKDLGLKGVRVASWHRGERKVPAKGPWRGWEPVVYRPARVLEEPVTDTLVYFSRPRTSDPDRVLGAKPAAFCFWLFRLVAARAGDTFDDLFNGSGGVKRAWRHYTAAEPSSRT